MTRETITLTKKEQQRAHVLSRVQAGALTARTAAELLTLSIRHVRRLLAVFRQHGLAALAHGNRGRVSPRRLAASIRARVLTLARTTYAGVNDHHLTELLAEREDLHLSRPLVRLLLRQAGLGSPRTRRPPRHRRRRERMPQAGLLIQMDGSHHPWLEDRGPRLVLHAAIDDATGEVLAGVFRPQEDAQGYFLLLRCLIRRYGVPTAAYTDRHGLFHRDPRTPLSLAEQLQGRPKSTQVGRALHELGIRWIPARSPQAKGRIERLFGTFQDRLVVELRLAHASTMAQAQRVLDRFLPRYNARFALAPAHPQPAWRPAPPDLDRICCSKYQRIVAKDNTVTLGPRHLQLLPGPNGRSYAGIQVNLYAQLNGTLTISYRGQRLRSKLLLPGQLPSQRPKERFRTGEPDPDTPLTVKRAPTTRQRLSPPPDHPWRLYADENRRRKQLQAQGVTFS